jgi:hypothetical protein
LRSTWDTDAPEAREAFLTILAEEVGTDDESFLEFALDDKRKAVRLAAADLLARLPESGHARRMLARLESLIELEAPHGGILGKLRKRKLRVDLPAAPDKAAQRDGIDALSGWRKCWRWCRLHIGAVASTAMHRPSSMRRSPLTTRTSFSAH